jgi:hypothetical protein
MASKPVSKLQLVVLQALVKELGLRVSTIRAYMDAARVRFEVARMGELTHTEASRLINKLLYTDP